jgi:hypothetical protein
MIMIEDRFGPFIATAIKVLARRDGWAPRELLDLADELLDPQRVASRRKRELSAARSRRWRARQRQKQVA